MITSQKGKLSSKLPTARPGIRSTGRPAGCIQPFLYLLLYTYSRRADTAAGIFLIKFRFANKDALAGRIPSDRAVDYKATPSRRRKHERPIPSLDLSTLFSDACIGKKAKGTRERRIGEGESLLVRIGLLWQSKTKRSQLLLAFPYSLISNRTIIRLLHRPITIRLSMANTVQPHFNQNVFLGQSHSVIKQQQNLGVGQDKGAVKRARMATAQPAPRGRVTRSQDLNNDTPRSQNKPTPKRKTIHLTLWVKPIVKTELKRLAEQEGLSVSSVGAAFLQKAMQTSLDIQYGPLLQPIIREAITKQMRSMSTRLAFLLVRVAFASEQTRSLATNILGRQQGVTPTVLNDILDGSSKAAKGRITHRTPQLEELIAEVERWFQEEDSKTHE
jgi:hypothetical protein